MQQGQSAVISARGPLKSGQPRKDYGQGYIAETGNANINANRNRLFFENANARTAVGANQPQKTEGFRFTRSLMRPVRGQGGGTHYAGNYFTGQKTLSVINQNYGTAILPLIQAWQGNPICGTNVQQQRQNLLNLLGLMTLSELNGVDIRSTLNTIGRSAEGRNLGIKVPTASDVRWAQGALDPAVGPRTYKNGRTNKTSRAQATKPSYLWFLIFNNCRPDQIEFITNAFRQVLEGTWGMSIEQAANYQNYQSSSNSSERNAELAQFWAAATANNPACQGVSVGWIARLLDDVDSAAAAGVDFKEFFREFTVQVGGPVFDLSKFRLGSGTLGSGRKGLTNGQLAPWTIAPLTEPGVRLEKTQPSRISQSNRQDKLKVSLLWYLAQNYCAVLPLAVTHLENIFRIPPPPGVSYTNLSQQVAQQLSQYRGAAAPPVAAQTGPAQFFGTTNAPGPNTATANRVQQAVSSGAAPPPTAPVQPVNSTASQAPQASQAPKATTNFANLGFQPGVQNNQFYRRQPFTNVGLYPNATQQV